MAEDVKSLIEKINQEGIQAAEEKARQIEKEAEAKAAELIKEAKARVQQIIGEAEAEALRTLDEVRKRVETLIVVSNEVGTGLVPPFRLGRIFRDLAGRLNQKMAQRADEVFLVSAGLPLRLKPGDTEVKRG